MKKVPTKSVRMWVARDEDGMLFLYKHKPTKNRTGSWTSSGDFLCICSELFPNVKWTDSEPTRVVLRLA